MSRKIIAHGTRRAYRHFGCRCDACRAWNAEQSRKYTEAHRGEINEARRAEHLAHKDEINARKRARYDPVKSSARNAVKEAVKRGRLQRGPCEVGGDCLGAVEAHHDDYSRKLDVRWLCKRHHRLRHLAVAV